ncbi:hypothetical protein CAPTEDRAFT_185998 [Capitella teleta]|uniref:Uncharacterized protein n=1 Tax=Capitella teleta TaxID=283909 RepID=R7TQH1_CAPTE|nr:hypothetical protein CAPTEDRAFT_185998 [Capitella teleta]|eukprot:ELT96173.1 hypothetical protein CAPTEDRAFT_185998 [Capitella teleta]
MGCNASTEKTSDPVLSKNGVSFSSLRSKNIKKKPLSANNRIHPGSTDNNSNSNGGPVANGKRAMRGDLSLYHDAKYKRNNYLRARHRTRENKAQTDIYFSFSQHRDPFTLLILEIIVFVTSSNVRGFINTQL